MRDLVVAVCLAVAASACGSGDGTRKFPPGASGAGGSENGGRGGSSPGAGGAVGSSGGACSAADEANACTGRECGRDPVCGVLCGTCPGAMDACQNGRCFSGCTDTQTNPDHCGSCGHVCRGTCTAGRCDPAFGECFDNRVSGSCAAYCSSIGETCARGACSGHTWMAWNASSTAECSAELSPIAQCGAPSDGFPCNHADDCGMQLPAVGLYRCCCQEAP